MTSTNATTTAEERAFVRLRASKLFQNYQSAFRLATGLALDLCSADEEKRDQATIQDGNRFCQMLNGVHRCDTCTLAHSKLLDAAGHETHSMHCFAKMRETAIPIKAGHSQVAFLRIGQIFDQNPTEEDFADVAQILGNSGYGEARIDQFKDAYLSSPVIEPERYEAAITLLETFALHLSSEMARLLVAETNHEPPVIRRTKQYLNANLEEKITLDAVADHVHVSAFYLCKLFKQATGMTITEYVNRRRVEWAKRKLLNPHVRITEVAYDVGYQSLSQFNRSFLKYAGESPTDFRSHALADQMVAA